MLFGSLLTRFHFSGIARAARLVRLLLHADGRIGREADEVQAALHARVRVHGDDLPQLRHLFHRRRRVRHEVDMACVFPGKAQSARNQQLVVDVSFWFHVEEMVFTAITALD